MISVYRTEKSQDGDWVEAELKAMVVGYRRILMPQFAAQDKFGEHISLPLITDGEQLVFGEQDLLDYLRRLERFVGDWRRFQSDACYVDEDEQVC